MLPAFRTHLLWGFADVLAKSWGIVMVPAGDNSFAVFDVQGKRRQRFVIECRMRCTVSCDREREP
jgi:hypothetical protein